MADILLVSTRKFYGGFNDGIQSAWIFLAAFFGAMLLYLFRLCVAYRRDPDNFEWAGWRDVWAQCGISLTTTVFTFLTLWKSIERNSPEGGLSVYPYLSACVESMVLELLLHVIGGDPCTRRQRE
jgi:hypothetical protein